MKDIFKSLIFQISGKRKFTYGYTPYKFSHIKKTLLQGDFNTRIKKGSYGAHIDERAVEYPWLFHSLSESPGRLLDAGSVLNFEFILDQPKLKNKDVFISTLAPEKNCFFKKTVSYVYEDIRSMCYKNDYFDNIVCLSTLEHIGMDNTIAGYTSDSVFKESEKRDYLKALTELHRVMKPGGTLYLSVPFGKMADHPWLQVFTADMLDTVIQHFNPASVEESIFLYTPSGWILSNRSDAANAGFYGDIRREGKPDPAVAAEAVACLRLVKK